MLRLQVGDVFGCSASGLVSTTFMPPPHSFVCALNTKSTINQLLTNHLNQLPLNQPQPPGEPASIPPSGASLVEAGEVVLAPEVAADPRAYRGPCRLVRADRPVVSDPVFSSSLRFLWGGRGPGRLDWRCYCVGPVARLGGG